MISRPKKIFSLLLAFMLLFQVAFQSVNLSISANNGEVEIDTAVENLKNAWQKMTTAVSSTFYPRAYHTASGWSNNPLNINDFNAANAPYGATKSMLGDVYSIDSDTKNNFDTINANGQHMLVFTKDLWGQSDNFDITNYKDIYVYIYIAELTESGKLKLLLNGNSEIRSEVISVDETWVGKWTKISVSDTKYFPQGFDSVKRSLGNKLNHARFETLKEGNTYDKIIAKTVVGTIMFDANVALPENSSGWNSAEWLVNAEALNISSYGNTEGFINAIEALRNVLYTDSSYAAENLKLKWKQMTEGVSSNFYPLAYHKNDNFSGNMLKFSTFNQDTVPYNATFSMLGTYYSELNFKIADTGAHLIGYFKNEWCEYGYADLSQYKDLYFYFYVSKVNTAGTLTPVLMNSNESCSVNGKPITINEDMAGKWVKISAEDIIDGGYEALTVKLQKDIKVVRLRVSDGLDADAVIGSIMLIKNVSLPTQAADWNNSDLYLAAKYLDTSAYGNVEPFNQAIEILEGTLDSDELTASVAKRDLKNAWQSLSIIDGEQLSPYRININSEFQNTDIKNSMKDGFPFGSNYGIVGQKYSTMNFNDDYNVDNVDDSKIRLFFEIEQGGGSSTIVPEECKEYYVYVYVNELTKPGKLAFQFVCHSGYLFVGEVAITADDLGKWKKLSMEEIFGKDYRLMWPDGIGVQRVQIGATEGLQSLLTFGSVIATVSASVPEQYDSWNLAECVFAAKQVDIADYDNTTAFEACLAAAEESVNASGFKAYTEEVGGLDSLMPDKLDGNILKNETPVINYYNGDEAKELTAAEIGVLNDGSADNEISFSECKYSGNGEYTDFIYKLNEIAHISRIMLINSAEQKYRTDKYEIFVGDKLDTLISEENCAVSFENVSRAEVNTFNFDTALNLSGSYVALRIKAPAASATGDNNIVRLREFGIYGTTAPYEVETGAFNSQKMTNIGKNLLEGVQPQLKANGAKKPWIYGNIDRLTDCDNSTATGINPIYWRSEDGYYVDIYYDLGDLFLIDKFFLHSFWNSESKQKQYLTGKYDIYVSEEMFSLFYDESKVLSYDNMGEARKDSTVCQLFDMAGGGVVGRYVAFRITMPVNNYEYAKQWGDEHVYVRLTELGVYGVPYVKPVYQINLAEHIPVELYRTDASGKHTAIGEDEITGTQIGMLYDGDYTAPVNINRNGAQVDVILNLCANLKLDAVGFRTLANSVKRMKVYATNVYDNIWDEDTLIYSYNSENPVQNYIRKDFNSQIRARYLRFSIIDTVGNAVDITEIEALGLSNQSRSYYNLALSNENNIGVYYQNKESYRTTFAPNSTKRWAGGIDNYFEYGYIADGDYDTHYDFLGGKNNIESINLVIDLEKLIAIDRISILAGSNYKYWPSKLNFYADDDQKAIFAEDSKPIKSFTELSDDGNYEYTFASKLARFVRIEILETHNPYYRDMIMAVISEIAVNGIGVSSNTAGDSVYSYHDSASGITLDVLTKYENDLYEKIQGISFNKRPATAEEKAQTAEYGIKFDSDIYIAQMLDSKGNPINDIDGRTVRVRIPVKDNVSIDSSYVAINDHGDIRLAEQTVEEIDGNFYLTVYFTDPSNILFAVASFGDEGELTPTTPGDIVYNPTEDSFEETDTDYSDDISDVTDNENNDTKDDDDDRKKPAPKKKVRVVRRAGGSEIDWLIPVIIAAGVVIAAAGIIVILVIRKKRRKEQ